MARATEEDSEREVVISWTETRERAYATDFDDMAKILGISRSRLKAILDDGEELEVSDKAKEKLDKLGDVDSDEWELTDFSEA